jgi:hypothetical protein
MTPKKQAMECWLETTMALERACENQKDKGGCWTTPPQK